jgi:hypothetical protein
VVPTGHLVAVRKCCSFPVHRHQQQPRLIHTQAASKWPSQILERPGYCRPLMEVTCKRREITESNRCPGGSGDAASRPPLVSTEGNVRYLEVEQDVVVGTLPKFGKLGEFSTTIVRSHTVPENTRCAGHFIDDIRKIKETPISKSGEEEKKSLRVTSCEQFFFSHFPPFPSTLFLANPITSLSFGLQILLGRLFFCVTRNESLCCGFSFTVLMRVVPATGG